VYTAGLASGISFDNVVLNGVLDNGVISASYTQYIYANSCRKLVAGMAEWNGGYAHINADNKLQIDKFSKTVSREYSSGNLLELDYSDETVTFTKIKTSQKNKTYERGDDSGYTLVINNQYISYGLDDANFELYLTKIFEYYSGFTLTPMSFTLAEPDLDLRVGDRVKVFDEEEQIAIYGNVSKIELSGNLSMVVTCGGFDSAGSSNSFTPTSYSQIQQSKQEAKAELSAGTVLTDYKYISDLSAQCNGITYTAEKDTETGLISKISDSNGNSLEPEIPAGITDAALHNAVFWAVAMARGLGGSSTIMPIIGGLTGYFDYKQRCVATQWGNVIGGNNIPITAGAIVDTDCLQMPDGVYSMFPFPYTDGVITVYAVIKCSEPTSGAGTWGINYLLGTGPMSELGNARFLGSLDGVWSCHSSGGTYDIISDVPSTDKYHVLCLVCGSNDSSSQSQVLYIDGQAVGNKFPPISPYGGVWGLNCICNGATVQERSHLTSYWKMMALGRTAHTAEQVAKNTAWLKRYYEI